MTAILDARCALRALVRSRVYAAGTIIAIAVITAATAIVFAIVNAVLLAPLPFVEPDRLVWIWSTRTDRDKAFFSIPNLVDSERANTTLQDVGAFANWGVNITGAGPPQRVQGARVTPNTFALLGVRAVLGRTLLPSDDAPAGDRMVVIANDLWQRRFGGGAAIVGSRIVLNGDAYEVVGVLPAGFVFPNTEAELFAPLSLARDPRRLDRGTNFLRVFGRLRGDATVAHVRDEWARITRELRAAYPEPNAKITDPRVLPLSAELLGTHRGPLSLVLAAVVGVWLLGCTNIVNLQLIRLVSRYREHGIRRSLGASPIDLVEPYLFESIFLVGAGGLLGAVAAVWMLPLLVRAVPVSLPRSSGIQIDPTVLAFTVVVVAATAIIIAVVPILCRDARQDDHLLRGVSTSPRTPRARSALAMLEVAAALCLLVTTTFVLKTLHDVQTIDPGVSLDNLVHARVSLPARYANQADLERFLTLTLDGLVRLPGVTHAAAANALPLGAQNIRTDFSIVGVANTSPTDVPGAQSRWVTSDYFETAGIRVLEGRGFTEADVTSRAALAVVDDALRTRFWPGRSPVGDEIRILDGSAEGRVLRIVGVVRTVTHFDIGEQPLGTLYGPVHQLPPGNVGFFAGSFAIAVNASEDSEGLRRGIVEAVRRVDADVPVSMPRTMADQLQTVLASRRFVALLLAVFAGAALALAISGVYTVISASARDERRELAIRLALGASGRTIVGHVLAQAGRLLLIGIPCGLTVTRLALPLLTPAIGPTSAGWWPWTVAPALLAAAALTASYLRARRVLDLDPARVLHRD